MRNVTDEDRADEDRPDEGPAWDYDDCEWPGCTEFATHRLYWGGEYMHAYCSPHMNEIASQHDEFWRDVAAAADTAAVVADAAALVREVER